MERFLKSRYKIGEPLGETPFSATYKGFYLGTQKPVVIKIYKRGTLNNRLIKSMRNRLKILLAFFHPSIAKLIDGDYGWQGFYFVREFIEGKSVGEILKENRTFTLEDALNIGIEVCKVLKFCHQNNMVHGALNPNNIFIDQQGIVKVTDFVVEGEIKESIEQKTEFVAEGAPYLSPEEVAGHHATPTSDIYALGLVLFEMLSGHHPFKDQGTKGGLELALKKLKQTPPHLTALAPSVPKSVEEVINRCLSRDPLLRFRSVEELESSLHNRSVTLNLPPVEDFPAFNYNLLVEEPAKKEVYSGIISAQRKKQFKQICGWVLRALLVAVLAGLGFAVVQTWNR